MVGISYKKIIGPLLFNLWVRFDWSRKLELNAICTISLVPFMFPLPPIEKCLFSVMCSVITIFIRFFTKTKFSVSIYFYTKKHVNCQKVKLSKIDVDENLGKNLPLCISTRLGISLKKRPQNKYSMLVGTVDELYQERNL